MYLAPSVGLSYSTSIELNKIIDDKLPGHPHFVQREIVVAGEAFDLYSRDIIQCVRVLFGDSEFAPFLFYVPERHYADRDKMIRMYHNMHTGKWWWATQVPQSPVSLEYSLTYILKKEVEKDNPGATILPIIISSDKT